jgi:hypothetical protein
VMVEQRGDVVERAMQVLSGSSWRHVFIQNLQDRNNVGTSL